MSHMETSKKDLIERISKLLDSPDVIVRIQRELTHVIKDNVDTYQTGDRVTIIIVGTPR